MDMTQAIWIGLLTIVASAVGTATGFGTSTIMIPILSLSFPLSVSLLFVGVIHLFGDLWKILLFKKGLRWKLVLGFGLPGIAASYLGASFSFSAAEFPLKRILGAFLLLYVVFLFLKRNWSLPDTTGSTVVGGLLSGLFAGFFGVGGAVRGAFLAAYNLPKEVYVFTSGVIALLIDATRLGRYLLGGTRLDQALGTALLLCVPLSFLGAALGKRFLNRLPQKRFRFFVGVFIALVAAKLLLWP